MNPYIMLVLRHKTRTDPFDKDISATLPYSTVWQQIMFEAPVVWSAVTVLCTPWSPNADPGPDNHVPAMALGGGGGRHPVRTPRCFEAGRSK